MPTSFAPPVSAEHPELFFALVAPVGVDNEAVCHALEAALGAVGYTLARGSKLSELLHALKPWEALGRSEHTMAEDHRIEKQMDAGDELRRELDYGGAVAALAIEQVTRLRGETPKPRTAYLFRTLKHPREVELLRSVYDSALFIISVYEPEDVRRRRLIQRFQRTGKDEDTAAERARDLMERDEKGGETNPLGQRVRETFPRADFFLDTSKDIRKQELDEARQLLGYAIPWDPKSARPRQRRAANPHLFAEHELCDSLRTTLVERGWIPAKGS